jgi:hypothetical protein
MPKNNGLSPQKPTVFHRVWRSVIPDPILPQSDGERKRYLLKNLVLHFRPLTVPEKTLKISLTWGLGGMAAVLILLQFGTGLLLKFAYEPHPVSALPGAFSAPGRALAYLSSDSVDLSEVDTSQVAQAFQIANDRVFDEDPRFGLIALSEIASRALSPAVNDPGTAIAIIGRLVRVVAHWTEPIEESDKATIEYDRVEMPEISLRGMFDDAFTPIARDGAGCIEVAVRLQKAFESLASMGGASLREVAIHHARLARARAETALTARDDLEVLRKVAKFTKPT